ENFIPNLISEGRKVFPAIAANNRAGAESAMRVVEEKLDEVDRFLKSGEIPGEPNPGTPPAVAKKEAATPPISPAELRVLTQRYSALTMRAGTAQMGLITLLGTPGAPALPPDVTDARN